MANNNTKTQTPAKAPKKARNLETLKTVTIAVLITGIAAFAAGAWTMNHYNDKMTNAVKAVQPTASAQAAPAPALK